MVHALLPTASLIIPVITWHRVLLTQEFEKDRSAILKAIQVCVRYIHYDYYQCARVRCSASCGALVVLCWNEEKFIFP